MKKPFCISSHLISFLLFFIFLFSFFLCLVKDGWNHKVFQMERNHFVYLFFVGHCIETISNIMESWDFMVSEAKWICMFVYVILVETMWKFKTEMLTHKYTHIGKGNASSILAERYIFVIKIFD